MTFRFCGELLLFIASSTVAGSVIEQSAIASLADLSFAIRSDRRNLFGVSGGSS